MRLHWVHFLGVLLCAGIGLPLPVARPVVAAQSSSLPPSTPAAASVHAAAPVQPIPFSHQQHAGTLHMPCQYCHSPSRTGATLLIPQAAFCMQCHQSIGKNDPGVEKLAAYARASETIPWVRIYQLPSFVEFSHKTHLQHGATCLQCHGAVADRVQLSKEADLSMAACIRCHQATKAPTECNTCHTLEQ